MDHHVAGCILGMAPHQAVPLICHPVVIRQMLSLQGHLQDQDHHSALTDESRHAIVPDTCLPNQQVDHIEEVVLIVEDGEAVVFQEGTEVGQDL